MPLYDPAHPQNTWHLAEGVELTFPAGASIPAGGYALIVNIDPAYFRTKYGIPASVPIFGPYLYELDKSGDTIELKYPDDPQPDGKVPYDRMDQVTYDDGGLWPKSADGFGASLNRDLGDRLRQRRGELDRRPADARRSKHVLKPNSDDCLRRRLDRRGHGGHDFETGCRQ